MDFVIFDLCRFLSLEPPGKRGGSNHVVCPRPHNSRLESCCGRAELEIILDFAASYINARTITRELHFRLWSSKERDQPACVNIL